MPAILEPIFRRTVSTWSIWTRNQRIFKVFSGVYCIKKRQSELARELCKIEGEGEEERERTSVSISGCEGYLLVPLCNSNTEGNGENNLLGNVRASWLLEIGGTEVIIGLLNNFSL